MPASIKRKAFAKVSKIFPFSRKNQSNILMYHRIIDPKDSNFILDPGMFITPHTFEKHLKFLVKKYTIISIEEYVANFHRPELIKNCYALTFDDGWIDFYDNAFPILKKYNLPACVFLPTSYIGTNNLMWPDELAIYKTAFNNLTNIQKTHFGNEINKKIKGEFSLNSNISDLILRLKQLTPLTRLEYLKNLKEILNQHIKEISNPLFMSWDNIKEIQNSSLITFGSHSHLHHISTEVNEEELSRDISTSLEQLKSHNIPNNNIFCYPNQTRSTNTDQVIKKLGFRFSLGKLNHHETTTACDPICFDRIGIHEDVSSSEDLFNLRLLGY